MALRTQRPQGCKARADSRWLGGATLRSPIQRCTWLAFRLLAKATLATEKPGIPALRLPEPVTHDSAGHRERHRG